MKPSVCHILLCFDRRFLLGAAVTIRSLTEHAREGVALQLHVVSPDLRADEMHMLQSSASPLNAGVSFSFHKLDGSRVRGLLRSKHVSPTAYARLLVGEILDPSIHRVVYVDVDVLFMRDVYELFELPLENKVLAAVPNGPIEDQQKNLRRLGVAAAAYFASGLLVIDLRQWRREHIGERALQFAREVGDRLVLHDQDALNGVILGAFVSLPESWCHWPTHGEVLGDAVIHYAMNPKPWHADYDGRFKEEFFEVLDRTPYAGWRPPYWYGLAPILFRLRRQLPYLPTATRLLRKHASKCWSVATGS
jgi:lipopolysaccharide biosynthesis glycosyltransferase